MRGTRPPLVLVTAAFAAIALAAAAVAGPGVSVDVRTFHFVDHHRTAHFRTGAVRARTLVTIVRYPAEAAAPLPLIVFGHGFAVTPRTYARLLESWAHAGFVVAAPVFPVESASAPGGPDEADLINQPGDMRFVISRLLAASADPRNPLYHLIDPRRIAVAGHSDGAETAFAVAYDSRFADPRVRAAVILSGSALPGGSVSGSASPPLLAVQGTADRINQPRLTYSYFATVHSPKFLLELLGARHLPPYTTNVRDLRLVERVTTAFLNHVLRDAPLQHLETAANARGIARFVADP